MRSLIIAAVLLACGLMFFTPEPEHSTPEVEPAAVVELATETSPWVLAGTYDKVELFEPPADPVPDAEPDKVAFSLNGEVAEMRELAQQMRDDATEYRKQADEIREMFKASQENRVNQSAPVCECSCDCDCPDIDEIREVVKSELAAALKDRMLAAKTSSTSTSTSNGSGGGSVTQSNGSGGGSVSTSSAAMQSSYYPPAPAQIQPVARYAVSTSQYVAASGCTVQRTTYSDGTTSEQTISCPTQRSSQQSSSGPVRSFFGRFGR